MFKVNNLNTRTASVTSIVDFEQVNVSLDIFNKQKTAYSYEYWCLLIKKSLKIFVGSVSKGY